MANLTVSIHPSIQCGKLEGRRVTEYGRRTIRTKHGGDLCSTGARCSLLNLNWPVNALVWAIPFGHSCMASADRFFRNLGRGYYGGTRHATPPNRTVVIS